MITFAPFPQTLPREHPRLNWLPLPLLTGAACAFTTSLPAWARMWLIAIALFAGFKWWTFRRAFTPKNITSFRPIAYLLLWPGMNTRAFLNETAHPNRPTTKQWLWALTKTLFGATLLWLLARLALPPKNNSVNLENSVNSVIPSLPHSSLLAGWIAMVGFIFLLHFGLFALLSLFWRSRGIDAAPLMNCPIAATSLHDFWGRRWNAGFRDIVFALFFFPLARRLGAKTAALLTFLLSGLLHELVITVPAGGGYGLPTLYFAIQGLGLMLERSPVAALVRAWPGARKDPRLTTASTPLHRLFTLAIVVLPIAALFPPIFVTRVMVPFFQLIHAL